MKITIELQDYEKSNKRFGDCWECPLAHAIRRQVENHEHVSVGQSTIIIRNRHGYDLIRDLGSIHPPFHYIHFLDAEESWKEGHEHVFETEFTPKETT